MGIVSRPGFKLAPLAYSELPGWAEDDHAAAFVAFRRGVAALSTHPPKARSAGLDPERLAGIIRRTAALPDLDAAAARRFFEQEFTPFDVVPDEGPAFYTGYYEPIVEGSRVETDRFRVPLYGPPADLVEIDPDAPPPGMEIGYRYARRTADGDLVPYLDRGAIQSGALAGQGLEIAWLADPIDAFFIHVQGAARLRLPDGGTMRVTYAAKTGHPYTSIGRELIAMGALERAEATMQGLRRWLAANPSEAPGVLARNRSFIFFREAQVEEPALGPVAAAKVPLTPGRSLAVDRLIHAFGAPVFIDATLPGGERWQRLMVAQDTGSAIVGPARGDIVIGSGDAAGEIAGALQARGRFVLLWPRGGEA